MGAEMEQALPMAVGTRLRALYGPCTVRVAVIPTFPAPRKERKTGYSPGRRTTQRSSVSSTGSPMAQARAASGLRIAVGFYLDLPIFPKGDQDRSRTKRRPAGSSHARGAPARS